MDAFFYWSGVTLWLGGGAVTIAFVLFVIIDRLINSALNIFNVKREFLAFAWERIKQRKDAQP